MNIIFTLIILLIYIFFIFLIKNKNIEYLTSINLLLTNKDKIFEIKRKVDEKNSYLYEHLVIPNIIINNKTISIIMTASNRSKQTYFTLSTIQNSSFKEIQVIIVDDSDEDPIKKEELEKYPFYIDFISIKKQNKNWINPCVNYNIGFQYIKGSKVVIQNAEVCHVGDVLAYMGNNMIPDNYYICDVRASKSLDANDSIYKNNINTIDIYKTDELFGNWLQDKSIMNNYHYLVGMTLETFNKIKKFSYDYTFGVDYDDNDFLLKIKSKNINIINLFYDEYHFGGIHLFHKLFNRENIESNNNLYLKKNDFMLKSGEYIDITENIDLFNEKYNIIFNN
jgi:hypothetical protein